MSLQWVAQHLPRYQSLLTVVTCWLSGCVEVLPIQAAGGGFWSGGEVSFFECFAFFFLE